MPLTNSKVTITQSIKWVPTSGDSINFAGSETFSQIGTQAFMDTVTVATTTTALGLGGVTGDKYFGVKNTEASGGSTVYVDTVTPVVTTAVSVKKLPPGKSMAIFTAANTWYAIADAGTPQVVVAAVQP